jgi:hypothetical protein
MIEHLKKWLLLVAIGHVAFGVALPFVAFSGNFDFYAAKIRYSFWNGTPVPAEAEAFERWIVALFGPTIASWGVLMTCLVRAGMRTDETWPWDGLLISLLALGPADIAISLMHDYWLHVIVDLSVVFIIAVPALMIRLRRTS